jgi:excisionase family DNA binding protein
MSIEKLYTKKEVAELLSLTTRTIENLMKSGELPFVKVANRVRFKESDIKALIGDDENENGGE